MISLPWLGFFPLYCDNRFSIHALFPSPLDADRTFNAAFCRLPFSSAFSVDRFNDVLFEGEGFPFL